MTDDSQAETGAELLSEKPLRGTRRTIARRLTEIWQAGVPVTLHRELDLGPAVGGADPEVGLTDRLIEAVIGALRQYPAFNATFDGEIHRIFADIHLGLAVDTPRGLLVPVLRAAQNLPTAALRTLRRDQVQRAQAGKHSPDEIAGGTFTISNLGPFGVDYFTPIINPPQVAILGLGRTRRTSIAWERNAALTTRLLLPVSLSFDHRVCDGADAARFLQALQDRLTSDAGGGAAA